MTIRKVAMLGLGLMGGGMARQLLDAGFDVTVWNRSADKAAPFVGAGARLADTPRLAAAGADVVVAMLADDDASRAVWLDDATGALAGMDKGTIAIEASTLTVDWVRALAVEADARGIGFLDAPVTGSRTQASEGKLRFLVGGQADVVTQAEPVFAAMGSETLHLGPSGSGALLKLVNNFMCGVQVASLAEAIGMIERSGLDPRLAVEVLTGGAPGSPLVNAVSQRMLARDYAPHFLVPLMAKDLAYAQAAFSERGLPLPSAAAAKALFDAAVDDGGGDRDIAAIIEPLRKQRA